jgi:hypothetical protein
MSRGGSGGGPVGVAVSGSLGQNEMGFGPHPGGDIKGYYGAGDHMQNYGHYGYPDSNGYYDNQQMYGNMTEEDHYRSNCMPMMEGYCNSEQLQNANCGPTPNTNPMGNAHLSMSHPGSEPPNNTHPHHGHHPHHMTGAQTNGHHGSVHHPMQVLNPNHGLSSQSHHRMAAEAPDSVLHPHHSAAAAAAAAAQVKTKGTLCDRAELGTLAIKAAAFFRNKRTPTV